MKKILIFIMCYSMYTTGGAAAVRDGNITPRTTSASRGDGGVSQRLISTRDATSNNKTTVLTPRTTTRQTPDTKSISASQPRTNSRGALTTRRTVVTNSQARTATKNSRDITPSKKISRAAETSSLITETRTGAEYERCKNAYFTCMDQFCMLKNDMYRRCSCNDRVYDLDSAFNNLTKTGEKLNIFTENLDVVGMSAAQAASMRNATDGENALTSDKSSSKALLQAIMNSISGKDSTVGGKYSDLNSINISFDTANAFGITDTGQVIATYNGKNLYSAVYPNCRQAVRADCNDAALQRAITAYLMAIEQDCNTVQTAVEKKQKEMKAAVREGSAMLDLARVENRKTHYSSDFTTCLNNVEASILKEEVCGKNYHKCLDNGEFIDITTGKPIAGVSNFNELANMLVFSPDIDAKNQKLSKIMANQRFVSNFESRTKKFATDALDKCVENADDVWSEYLDQALLSIYYAQQAKVSEVKQQCLDYIASCYNNASTGLNMATSGLASDNTVLLQPDIINLNTAMCKNYINSCNNMFGEDVITEFVQTRTDTDIKTACRAVAHQCFKKFGGTNYQNFYNPISGIITPGNALDWFTLYEYKNGEKTLKSECAKQLAQIESCKNILPDVFGGFDIVPATAPAAQTDLTQITDRWKYTVNYSDSIPYYGAVTEIDENNLSLRYRTPRPTGVATEVYNQIIDTLSTQCMGLQGRFVEYKYISTETYKENNLCKLNNPADTLKTEYGLLDAEDVCPLNYAQNIDTNSYGACLCWENGGRRSKNGLSTTCVATFPVKNARDNVCAETGNSLMTADVTINDWCTANSKINKATNQVCPLNGGTTDDKCVNATNEEMTVLPLGIIN